MIMIEDMTMEEMLAEVKVLRQEVIDYSNSMASIIGKLDIVTGGGLEVAVRASRVMTEKLERIAELKEEFEIKLDNAQRV